MNKLFKTILICIIVVVLVVVMAKTIILESIMKFVFGETKSVENTFDELWYFSKLTEREKDVYLRIANAINNNDDSVVVVGKNNLSASDASRAYEAYMLDNPECFYISSNYQMGVSKFLDVTKIKIKLTYSENIKKLESKKMELEEKVGSILSEVVSPTMTSYEKEVALHDYLIENVSYYNYENVDDIPLKKHSAYGALVEKEAVCDGISKAYSILLKKCGIQNVVVLGKMGNQHAWNKVKIDDSWYNVDVTSDACGKERIVSHVYFNLTDEVISKSHTIDLTFQTPECSKSNDYYTCNAYEITNQDFLSDKISKIVSNTKGNVLEFRIESNAYDIQDVVQKLYDMDFNKYKTNKIKEMSYYYIGNIFIIPKTNK
mgnify:CR=1 FL=1